MQRTLVGSMTALVPLSSSLDISPQTPSGMNQFLSAVASLLNPPKYWWYQSLNHQVPIISKSKFRLSCYTNTHTKAKKGISVLRAKERG